MESRSRTPAAKKVDFEEAQQLETRDNNFAGAVQVAGGERMTGDLRPVCLHKMEPLRNGGAIMLTADGFGLSKIGQICITAHDVDRAVAFYRDKLGMKYLFAVPKMAFFDCSGVMLMLGMPEGPQFDHPSSVVYFDVDDIDESYSTMAQRGVRFEGKPHLIAAMDQYDLWMAFFRDSEENLLALMSKKRK